MQRDAAEIFNSPKQRFAKLLHFLKTRYRVEKRAEVAELAHVIEPQAIIFDIGAHFGQYAKAFAELNGGTTQVYCFEPVGYTRDILNKVVKPYRNIRVFSNGFSNTPGEAAINIPVKKSGKIGPGLAHLGAETSRDFVQENITLDTVDNFVDAHALPRLDFIKMDIEGPELMVLQGALQTLQKHRPAVFCEVSHPHMARMGLRPEDLFTLMHDAGYVAKLQTDSGFVAAADLQRSGDYLFVADDAAGYRAVP